VRWACLILSFGVAWLRLEASYKIEGFGCEYDNEERLFLISTFLPYKPTILALSPTPEIRTQCTQYWPHAPFFYSTDCSSNGSYDLVWLEGDGSERETLLASQLLLQKTQLIYTSTNLKENEVHFHNLKKDLASLGFTLLTHWYWENEAGHALFLRNRLYHALKRTLSYTPSGIAPAASLPFQFEPHLHSFQVDREAHRMEEIDCIYMINLDERPEKFAQAAMQLQLYGINPYRFSAVNGWKLPLSAMDEIGLKLSHESPQEEFLGSTYLEEAGKEYIHTEFVGAKEVAYFTRYLARGAIGIVLSHLSILQHAYTQGYETIWVMEDDIEVLEDPRQIPSLLRELTQLVPDWDIFFTDIDTKNAQGQRVPCRALAARPNVAISPLAAFFEKFYAVGNNFYRTGMRYGAYSMILRRSGIKKILDYYRAHRVFIPYDMDFWLCPDLKMFYFNRDIVSHRAGSPSDNNKPRYTSLSLASH
jgi:GR25 family glycosyltransferase involved in LPS biosynthesis